MRLVMMASLAATVVSACAGRDDPVVIGVAFPGSISGAAYLAAEEINAGAGVGGRRLELVVDTIAEAVEPADHEIQRALRLVARRPVAVAGHGGSRGSLAAAPVYNAQSILQLVPIGTSRLLRESGRWTIRMAPDDSVEGAFLADFVRDSLRARSVVLFHMSDEYGFGIRRGVEAALAETGVLVTRAQRFDTESDFTTLVEAAFRGPDADVAVIAGRSLETAAIVRAVRLLAAAATEAGPSAGAMRDWILELGVSRPRFRGLTAEIGVSDSSPPRFVMGMVRDSMIVSLERQP